MKALMAGWEGRGEGEGGERYAKGSDVGSSYLLLPACWWYSHKSHWHLSLLIFFFQKSKLKKASKVSSKCNFFESSTHYNTTIFFTSFFFQQYADRTYPLLILGSLMFIPGFYHVRIAYYAWKGYRGYSFEDIPDFDWLLNSMPLYCKNSSERRLMLLVALRM